MACNIVYYLDEWEMISKIYSLFMNKNDPQNRCHALMRASCYIDTLSCCLILSRQNSTKLQQQFSLRSDDIIFFTLR